MKTITDTSIKAQSRARLYWPGAVPPFMEIRGLVTAGGKRGALIYFKQTGIYALGCAGVVSSIPQPRETEAWRSRPAKPRDVLV
jgi:hypothetical protein